MNDKNDFDTANIKINPDNDYPTPKRKSLTPPLKNKGIVGMFGKIEMPFILLGIGLVAFVGIYLGLSVLSGGNTENEAMENLTTRLSNLEQKISQMESADMTPSGKIGDTDDLAGRLDRTEATMSLRLNVIEKRLDDLSLNQRPPASGDNLQEVSEKKKATPSITVAPPEKKKAPPTKIVYHKIKKGETYYSISKKYGLTVAKLQKMNKLKPEDAIFPGQKLIVKR